MDEKSTGGSPPPDLQTSLQEINELIASPGYFYALLIIIAHDLFLTLDDFADIDWWSRLSYQEIAFLFGLLVKKPIDLSVYPSPEAAEAYIQATYQLMKDIHDHYGFVSIDALLRETLELQKAGKEIPDSPPLFNSPESIIEAVFYGDSGAYDFQYWESAPKRYAADDGWIQGKLGFSISDAVRLSQDAKQSGEARVKQRTQWKTYQEFCDWLLGVFSFSLSDLSLGEVTAKKIIDNFSVIPGKVNPDLTSPDDKNVLIIKPIIQLADGSYLLPVSFHLAQAIDERPFHIMREVEEAYFDPTALKHRGDYTEDISFETLKRVFGEKNVFHGVRVKRKKGEDFTDIDVLVLLGNKVIIIQAKSKKMNLISRQGNLEQLAKDFKKAVQEAYEQGITARKHVLARDSVLEDSSGNIIEPDESLNEAYIIVTTTDNYPALELQLHAFLKKEPKDPFPMAVNIYDLEILTKYLPDAYDFLFYVNQRTKLADKIFSGTEIGCLGYHLNQRLYLDPNGQYGRMMIADDFAQLIDDDIMRQKYGETEQEKQSKLYNKWKNESFKKLVEQLKSSGVPGFVDAVFLLFSISSETADKLVEMVETAKRKAINDGKTHTFEMPVDGASGGFTFVVKPNRSEDLFKHVQVYAYARKRVSKASEWLGMGCYAHSDNIIDCATYSKETWEPDEREDAIAQEVIGHSGQQIARKIGRNELCYCGSGIKYKKCCYLKK